jgi:hypothetical protein
MKHRKHIDAALTLSMLAAPLSHAQTCQPHWASISCESMPGWPLIGLPTSHIVNGHPELVLTAGLEDVNPASGPMRWQGQAWNPFPFAGIPPQSLYGGMLVFDDGSGERLYYQNRAAYPNTHAYRFEGNEWTLYPDTFTPASGRQSVWSFDLGFGMRTFGQLAGTTRVGMWDGSNWVVIGDATSGSSGNVSGLAALPRPGGQDLYAIGSFTTISGSPAAGFARWDGAQWHSVWGQPMLSGYGQPRICTYDDGTGPALFTNSTPQTVPNGAGVQGLYRFDGTNLTLLGATSNGGGFPLILALQVFDDGRGPALYIGGGFTSIGGVPARNLARWDGHQFEQVGGGVLSLVKGLGVMHDERGLGLWVQSDPSPTVVYAGGGVANGLAVWFGCKEPNCYTNCDLSTAPPTLNINDFMCFMNAYARRDPFADCTTDGVQNIADFQCFMTKFAAGCP